MAAKQEMALRYDPGATEDRLYRFWEERGFFTPPEVDGGEPFVIVIPPPNITGELHHGHAMFVAFQDLMIRYHRMLGEPTLWLPGTDHASIATHYVVERELAREGLTRHDLGRERFVERVWEWREKYGSTINRQLRRLGASCDWTRERFTLDEGLSRAVRAAFVRLYRQGLIYRGPYLVNWCPRCGTAISNLEVEHKEEPGHLYYVRYPLEGGGFIQVATTRPETILGDTAVAVNPDDERYKDMVGRIAILPAIGRRIPIIADRLVDPEFGTGAVKVTPGHDPNDYEIGQRHKLEIVSVMTGEARMNEEAGPYAGMERYECRQALLEDLERQGLLVKVEDHIHAIGHCQRCDTVIEPLISEQWFVKAKPLAKPAIAAVREGRIRIIPPRFAEDYFHWMENIQDWCISRQLWWGHRLPVWYCEGCGEVIVETETPTSCPKCGSASLRQDPDVLDTWFSSGLWPFSTLGWPDDTPDLRRFYPTSVMETAYDILFFWVARMIMLGLECMGEVPFRIVYIHGLMRDEQGEKISKSKGNAPDVLDIVREYGADALRFTIITGSTPGADMRLYGEKLEAGRNFANKLWNAARFVVSNLDGGWELLAAEERALTLADRWILSRHNRLISEVSRLMEEYQFGEAGRELYEFLWGEYCDWYIEMAKIRLYRGSDIERRMAQEVLSEVLERTLRLLHPFMPFVTEEIWQHLPHRGESLIIAPWPQAGRRDEAAEADMQLIMDLIRGLRNIRSEYRVEPGRHISALVEAGDKEDLFRSQAAVIASLARVALDRLTISRSLEEEPRQAVPLVVGAAVVAYLPLEGLVDLAKEKERLRKELQELGAEMARTQKLLDNHNFVQRAPHDVVSRERGKLASFQEREERLVARLQALEG